MHTLGNAYSKIIGTFVFTSSFGIYNYSICRFVKFIRIGFNAVYLHTAFNNNLRAMVSVHFSFFLCVSVFLCAYAGCLSGALVLSVSISVCLCVCPYSISSLVIFLFLICHSVSLSLSLQRVLDVLRLYFVHLEEESKWASTHTPLLIFPPYTCHTYSHCPNSVLKWQAIHYKITL